ncbi:hypothetical protein IEQ34_014136 [Dendrobium chrysotoxum]|uniref:Uncharacterized protein n=1 Tax=Dendrobium chrysotoxum TaxID=161865 RepID=A0AAV7GKM7_DENCH|nr:hypothetical protein IEQ34_014136 [Dendrobium chrysotoxum]
MGDFPSYCAHCKSLGHSKMGSRVLHPHLDKAPIINPISINVGDKLTNDVHDNDCAGLTVGDVGLSNEPIMWVTDGPAVPPGMPVVFSISENNDGINNTMSAKDLLVPIVNIFW